MDLIAVIKGNDTHLTPLNPYDFDGGEFLFYMFEAEEYPSYPIKGFTLSKGDVITDGEVALIEVENSEFYYVLLGK